MKKASTLKDSAMPRNRSRSRNLHIYERLLRNKKDRVVVPIENRTCSGCHIVLTAQHENLVRKGENLVFCEHCSRIHYWQESEAFEGTASQQNAADDAWQTHKHFFGKAGNRCHVINAGERKVWTSQEKIPVKDWGPQGYGKCNRKYPLSL